MTECQGCGAWNDASRTLCVLCAAPLAETDEWDAAAQPPPLPPLPDGGLGASMPAWLREPSTPPLAPAAPIAPFPAAPPSLGARTDPRAFLSDDDFPRWLRDLAAQRLAPKSAPARTEEKPPPAQTSRDAAIPADVSPQPESTLPPVVADPAPAPLERPPAIPASFPNPAPPLPDPAHPQPRDERRRREPWETLLLAALLIGVIAGALWALAANGMLGPVP